MAPLPVELEAVLGQFKDFQRVAYSQNDNRTYYRASIDTELGGKYQVVVTLLPRMGNLESAIAAHDLLRLWKPHYLLVTGIAGGARPEEQKFGDVLVGESIFYYELGKLRMGRSEVRPRVMPADSLLYDRALNFDSTQSKNWFSRIPKKVRSLAPKGYKPTVHFGPIASGDKVVADSVAISTLRNHQPKLIGVEMESAGAASVALSAVEKVGFLSIRGISDFADAEKNDEWRVYAANTAAAWLAAFLTSEPIRPQYPTQAIPEPAPAEMTAPPKVDRVALLNAITKRVDNEDFKTLCFVLGVDVDEIPGDRKSARVRELIRRFERNNELERLAQVWTEFPEQYLK